MPVIFTKPMAAYADFTELWRQPNGVFSYLLNLKDSEGRPLYQPHPSPPIYPLLTVNRKSWGLAQQRNFGSQWNRRVCWPTVSSTVKLSDLATVRQSRMPQAWDYHLQLDHYATTPAGQAHFIQELQLGFFPSASVLNTWIKAVYPGTIIGTHLIRVVLDGDLQDATEEEPQSGVMIYRTTANLIVEGWVPDPDYLDIPAFWTQAETIKAVSPSSLEEAYKS